VDDTAILLFMPQLNPEVVAEDEIEIAMMVDDVKFLIVDVASFQLILSYMQQLTRLKNSETKLIYLF
jgi:hypothetical protein